MGLAGLVALLYANSLTSDFVFDARVLILQNPYLKDATAPNVLRILQHSYWWPYAETALYRPATTLSYLVNYSVLGNADRPVGYHLVNVLLHVTNTWLLLAVMLRLSGRLWPAILTAAVWAAHPLDTEAVTNIVGRADLLAACGVLGAFYAHLRARASVGPTRTLWLGGLTLMAALASCSKESGVTVVAVIVLYDLLFRQRQRLGSLLPAWGAAGVPVLLFLMQRALALRAATNAAEFPFVDNPILGAPFWTGRLTALAVAARYLWLVVWPAHLSADYSFPQIPLATGAARDWLTVAALVAVLVVSGALFWRNRTALFLAAASALTFLPVSNLLFPTGTIMAERLLYLPLAFAAGALVHGVYSLERAASVRPLWTGILCVAIVAFGLRTSRRNPDWNNELSLWTATATSSPRSFKSHGALAEAMYNADASRSNLDRVIAEKEISLSLIEGAPDPAATSKPYREAATYYLERGEWLEQHQGAPDQITAAYERSAHLVERYLSLLDVRPAPAKDRTDAQLLRSTAYDRLHKGDQATAAALQAERGDPFNPLTYRLSAGALLGTDRPDDAAVTLMTGFMVTGNADLRASLVELYRSGLDAQGCAARGDKNGPELNPGCEIVRRHLCAAASAAFAIQRRAGRADLADQLAQSTATNCAPSNPQQPP